MNNYLEYNINQMINFINKNNLGYGFKLHPNRNYKGVYISGESFDYIILTPANIFCFDAKQTINDRWVLKKKDKKQALNLIKISKFGAKSFFLIYFIKYNKLMKLDIENLFKFLNKRKYVKMSDCSLFNYKEDLKIGLSGKKD